MFCTGFLKGKTFQPSRIRYLYHQPASAGIPAPPRKKNESTAKYSVLNDRKQVFASKYMPYLSAEKELALELEQKRRLIEAHRTDADGELLADSQAGKAWRKTMTAGQPRGYKIFRPSSKTSL